MLEALLTIADRLRDGRRVDARYWIAIEALFPEWITIPYRNVPPRPAGARTPAVQADGPVLGRGQVNLGRFFGPERRLAFALNRLTEIGGVRLRVDWRGKQAEIGYGSETLFGALATQTLLAATSRTGLAFCSQCGNPFFYGGHLDRRSPREGEDRFCPDHSDQATAVRSAQDRLRARKRAEANGEPIPEWAALRRRRKET